MTKLFLASALLLFVFTPFARAKGNRSSLGSDITIVEGESAGNIACAFCSVHIDGDAQGNVAVFFGSVTVAPAHNISGNVAIFGGDLNLNDEAFVGGNVAIMAGNANLASTATINGGRTVLPGRIWLLLPFTPLFILIGIIWLIVYLVRRNRYHPPAYPTGPGISGR